MPSAEEMASFGYTEEDFASDQVDIWPDNQAAFNLFSFMQTQWRVGANGPSGLDFNVAYKKMDRMGLSPADYDQLEADIQTMEVAALNKMHESSGGK